MKNRKITMNDIAREAGVAKSTVSRYFNGGYVKESTREKIRAIARAYNYEPSAAAANLKLKKTRTVGIIAPTLDSITSGRMLESMDRFLKKNGYTVLIVSTSHDVNQEVEAINYLQSIRVDGIILIATNLNLINQQIVNESKIPILVVAQNFHHVPSVIYDDYRAGYEVGQYAGARGHKSVLYLGVNRVDDAVGVQRRKGVLEGLEEAGVERIHVRETDFSFARARRVVRQYLRDHSPDCIIGATDTIALAAYKELTAAGKKVPEDVSLIGFGGYEVSDVITPGLCTIRFNNELCGQTAGKTIIGLIEQEPVATTQLIGYEFHEGGSVRDRHEP